LHRSPSYLSADFNFSEATLWLFTTILPRIVRDVGWRLARRSRDLLCDNNGSDNQLLWLRETVEGYEDQLNDLR
jgi:hypothetical protein